MPRPYRRKVSPLDLKPEGGIPLSPVFRKSPPLVLPWDDWEVGESVLVPWALAASRGANTISTILDKRRVSHDEHYAYRTDPEAGGYRIWKLRAAPKGLS